MASTLHQQIVKQGYMMQKEQFPIQKKMKMKSSS